ncbi:hypothetical protein J1N35_008014 [Gossypium stocksii]|uniref:Uncharacterized protein n=1 Tax=Gossypium stocksii TaxID=47602 RepID=A0A9D3W7J8_9ROSI|nr:hypothetical protein J1N35_008014 [Gossypium stocksii]
MDRNSPPITEEEKANEEKETDDDEEEIEDDDAVRYRNYFENVFASKQPSTRGSVIRELIEQPGLSYKKSIVKEKGKGLVGPSEGP